MQCASGAGGNGLIDRTPVGRDDQHLARLDVALVGGADEIHRARFRADDDGVAQPAERQRAEPMRIADRDQPILASASPARTRPAPARPTRRSRLRCCAPSIARRGAGSTSVSLFDWKIDPCCTSSSRSSRAFTMLPLWQSAIWPCAQSIRIGWAFEQLALAGGRIAHVADRQRPGQRRQRLAVEDVGDVAHRPRDAHLLRRPTRRCRRSPARDAAARTDRDRSCWPLRDDRRCRRRRIRP